MANVVLINTAGRQYPLSALVDLQYNHIFDSGVIVSNIFKLPPKAVIVGGAIDIIVPSNDGGVSTLNVGDAANPTRYVNGVNLKAAGRTILTLTDYLSDGADIILTPTNTGTATAGLYRMHLTYLIAGRATEAQPN